MEIAGWKSSGEKVKEVLFDSNQNRIIFGCGHEILIVDNNTGKLVKKIMIKDGFDSMPLHTSKHSLAYGDSGTVNILNTKNWKLITKIHTRVAGFHSLDWSPGGEFIVAGFFETEILILDVLKSTVFQRLDQECYSDRSRNNVKFMKCDNSFLSSAYNSLTHWVNNGKKFKNERVYSPRGNQYGQIMDWDVSPDGDYLAAVMDQEQSYKLILWDAKNTEAINQKELPDLSLRVKWSPTNNYLALAEWEKVSIWNALTLQCVKPHLKSGKAYEPTSLAFNNDGSILWAGTELGEIKQWKLGDIELKNK